MKRAGIVLTVLFSLLAFVVGFGGTTAALLITRPAGDSHQAVRFVVNEGDTTTDVADNLAKAGLIRNALVFRYYARYKHLDQSIQQGVYDLNASMTMDQIIAKLQTALPDEQIVAVPPGLRVEQYSAYFTDLPSFNADNFKKIVKTGALPDGTKLSEKYWFVAPPQPRAVNALEGYLYPDTYYFDKTANEVDVVERLLTTLGQHICPGPQNDPSAYLQDVAQCKEHAAKVGNSDIFAAMEKAYNTKDDTLAFYKALTIASIVMREVKKLDEIPGVTNLYYTRYKAIQDLSKPNAGAVVNMGADPTAQYALETQKPPADGKYWQQLKDAAANVATSSPYNTNVPTNHSLPPGPISSAFWDYVAAAATPSTSKYFYFVSDNCGNTVYAVTLTEQNQNKVKYVDQKNCVK
jgi:UPF0755 protein